MRQLKMNLNKGTWGGRREKSGRKRIHSKGVAHRTREKVTTRTPLHINFKYKTSIRNKFCLKLLKRAIKNARGYGLKVIHFSLQHNHIHLIIEANNNDTLTTGMRSLTITFAKGLNQGKVQIERYHLHVLKSLQETKNAVRYVLFNKQKHEKGTCSHIDEYCSLWGLKNYQDIIKKFGKEMRMTLILKRHDIFGLDKGNSFLLQKGLKLLSV